jgi:hypothetical protein
VNFNIKLDGVDDAMRRFDPKQVEKVARQTLNRVAASGKTAASDAIRNTLKVDIRKGDLDRKIDVRPARGSALQAILTVTGSPLVLTYFNARQGSIMVARNKAGAGAGQFGIAQRLKGRHGTGPVQVTIMKGKTTTLSNRSFIATGKGGVPMVFLRKADGKLMARKVYRESSMFGKKVVMDVVKARIVEQWNKEWANAVKNRLQTGQGLQSAA